MESVPIRRIRRNLNPHDLRNPSKSTQLQKKITVGSSSIPVEIIQVINYQLTNVTPIIRTHNILTSHNQTHKNPLEPIKKMFYYYGFVSQQVTSEKL